MTTAAAAFTQLDLFRFRLTRTGLTVADPAKPPRRSDWEELGDYLSFMEGAQPWLVGDWLAYGEANFGEKAAQAIDATGWQLDTVKQAARVAEKVPPSRRDPDLSWTHHRCVVDLAPAEQKAALKEAKDHDWSVAEFRHHLRKTGKTEVVCWLVVSCKDEKDRDKLQKRLELEGRSCKLP
jgi:hypothetical protein